jgi:uncharacterized protein (TIGR04141 family)
MSHLFAQGTVSARLLRTVRDYREKVATSFLGKYGTDFDADSDSRVVYAIGTPRDGPIAESLFFFSLVNLVQHKEMLDAMGVPIAVCRISRDGAD